MTEVFISYSRKDIAFARLLNENLQQSQIETWIDWARIPIGVRWWQEISEAIVGADVFIFIISKASIGSKVCKEEIDIALKNNKRIIPVIVDELTLEAIKAFIPEMSQFNWIALKQNRVFHLEKIQDSQSEIEEDRQVALPKLPQFKEALVKLDKAIHTDWDWVKFHTRLQVDALRWESKGRDPQYLLQGGYLKEAERILSKVGNKDPAPSAIQIDFVQVSKKNMFDKRAQTQIWWVRTTDNIQYAPDYDLQCVYCENYYTFTPSEHLPIPESCPTCGFKGFGQFVKTKTE